jgi:glycosyltransferase involved in cell wall biosynthesis
MKIIVHALFDHTSIRHSLGRPEYSYFFVQAAFLPVLETIGTLVPVAHPDEADVIYDACAASGEACVFISFTPPHLAPVGLRCPVIPVFAWEFSTIPCEAFGEDERADWRRAFASCGRAITLSRQTAQLVREAMGDEFPVFAIPAPSYDRFADIFPAAMRGAGEREISLHGHVFDTQGDERFLNHRPWPHRPPPAFPIVAVPAPEPVPVAELPALPIAMPAPPPPSAAPVEAAPPRRSARERLSLTAQYAVNWYRHVVKDIVPGPVRAALSLAGRSGYRAYRRAVPLPAHLIADIPPPATPVPPPAEPVPPPAPAIILPPPLPPASVCVAGIVYATVLSPQDGRKNWTDLVSGFVWALRDRADATLIVKMPAKDAIGFHEHFDAWLTQLAPFQCRVIALYGFLDDAEYEGLVSAADYVVNTSSAEGLCLPLMEFLSAGRPALAPDHSAMADYVTAENAFVLASSLEHNVWPHDPRELYTTMRHRLNWRSLTEAYEASHALAAAQDGGYAAMAQRAKTGMRAFCAADIVREKLCQALPASRFAQEPGLTIREAAE